MFREKKDMWIYESPEKSGLEQGVYYRIHFAGNPCAGILPLDQNEPIDAPGNAMLITRDFGATDFYVVDVPFSLAEAKQWGEDHVADYASDVENFLLRYTKGYKGLRRLWARWMRKGITGWYILIGSRL